jgi:hypothetical protein
VSPPGPTHGARTSVWREWPLIVVLAVIGTGLWIVVDDHFRRGTVVFALGVCLAAVLRGVLPNGSAGLLEVRSRFVDVLTLAALGAATLVAALIVPAPS